MFAGEGSVSPQPVETIYFGGGTPSVLNREQLGSIFKTVRETFELDAKEITLEANPEHITPDYLNMLTEQGITRLSMGVQSFDPGILASMHRAHDREQAIKALSALKDFSSWSCDLIYGNPGQTLEMLRTDVEMMLSFDPPHISAYSLTLEERTRLHKEVQLGRTQMPEQDRVAEHAEFVSETLRAHGYERYEVSSYARPGHRAVHNHRYWNHVEYLGFGPSAHSFLWEHSPEGIPVRWSHDRDLRAYLSQRAGISKEKLSLQDLAEERIMMGFRTSDGVMTHELLTRYGYRLSSAQFDWIMRKMEERFVQMPKEQNPKEQNSNTITLTESGLAIADTLTVDFLALHETSA